MSLYDFILILTYSVGSKYPADLTEITEVEKELNSIVEKLKVLKAEAIREAIKFHAGGLQELEEVSVTLS